MHLGEIVVFAFEPEDRNEGEERIFLLEPGCKLDRGQGLEYGIQRPSQDTDLLTGHHRVRRGVLKGSDMLQGLR